MKKQDYKNHIRFYTPHHFVFYPLLLILLGIIAYFIFGREKESLLWIFISILLLLFFGLSFMLRQHYAFLFHDRIIRLELRYRYFSITN